MDSPSGLSSNSSDSDPGHGLWVSGSEENLLGVDQKKMQRMISNRESARRSRLRKQSHVNGLRARAAQLREDNGQMLDGLHVTSQLSLRVEAENAILRAQAAELSHRLCSLNEIARSISHGIGGFASPEEPPFHPAELAWFSNDFCLNQSQPTFYTAAAPDVGGFLC